MKKNKKKLKPKQYGILSIGYVDNHFFYNLWKKNNSKKKLKPQQKEILSSGFRDKAKMLC